MSAPLYFTCGTANVPTGSAEFDVSGVGLSFVPASVSVSVRQPSSEADVITAVVVGTPTADGFRVCLSSPASTSGYVLDWQAMSGVSLSVDTGSGAVSYTDIAETVARFLGYDPSDLTDAQKDEVDDYIQAGVRNFYYPPKMEGVDETFEWEFLKRAGSLTTSPGVGEYMLADGFGRMAGGLSYGPSEHRRDVCIVPFGEIAHVSRGEAGAPRVASVTFKNQFGSSGQRCSVILYPVPDKAYTLTFRYDADTGKLDASERPYPLGGGMYSELVVESCLAVAEQRANDEVGIHTQTFNRLLASMVARGRKQSAQNYGFIGEQNTELLGW